MKVNYVQENVLAMAVTGIASPEQWGDQKRPVDFYDIKHDLEAIFELNGCLENIDFKPGFSQQVYTRVKRPSLLTKKGESVGFIGLMHPSLEKELDIKKPRLF